MCDAATALAEFRGDGCIECGDDLMENTESQCDYCEACWIANAPGALSAELFEDDDVEYEDEYKEIDDEQEIGDEQEVVYVTASEHAAQRAIVKRLNSNPRTDDVATAKSTSAVIAVTTFASTIVAKPFV